MRLSILELFVFWPTITYISSKMANGSQTPNETIFVLGFPKRDLKLYPEFLRYELLFIYGTMDFYVLRNKLSTGINVYVNVLYFVQSPPPLSTAGNTAV